MKLPSEEKVWMNYYPKEIQNLQVPNCSLSDYLKINMNNLDDTCIKFYGENITYKNLFKTSNKVAKTLVSLNINKTSQIPVFLEATPSFLMILLGIEQIGASIVCRDGTLEEEVEVIKKANAKIIFVHDDLDEEKEIAFKKAGVETFIIINKKYYTKKIPDYIQLKNQRKTKLKGIDWFDFLNLGKGISFNQNIDYNIPLLRVYTTGTTGDPKQVIHSTHTIINTLVQMSLFTQNKENTRLVSLHTILPPSLVATVVSMMLFPISVNMILILDPYVDVNDIDLSFMLYKPNMWPNIPMFSTILMNSKRIPEKYDMSYFMFSGAGAEFLNKKNFKKMQNFLNTHNCKMFFGSGYGMSEACSNVLLPIPNMDLDNFSYGIPMPLTNVGIFQPNTINELNYGELGEFCICSDSIMLGYDNQDETNKTIKIHKDGKRWLHTGDIGYITKMGQVHIFNRGFSKHYKGENLFISLMENKIIDIEGIKDAFFVLVPDKKHKEYFVPHLYLSLHKNYNLEDIEPKLYERLEDYEYPKEIHIMKERPFFHFKTARKLLIKDILDNN